MTLIAQPIYIAGSMIDAPCDMRAMSMRMIGVAQGVILGLRPQSIIFEELTFFFFFLLPMDQQHCPFFLNVRLDLMQLTTPL